MDVEGKGPMTQDPSDPSPTSSQNSTAPSQVALVEAWPGLPVGERKEAFRKLSRPDAEELFLNLKAADQAELINEISTLEKRSWVRLLAPDDVADLLQELEEKDRAFALGLLDETTRKEVSALLTYEEDNAGGLMNSRFVRLRPDVPVDEAIRYLRLQAKTQVETVYSAYVLDAQQHLLGVVSFRDLLIAPPEKKVREIMETDIIRTSEHVDQEEVGRLFTQHDLMTIPVVDEEGRMKGIVTLDDIVSVVEEEATEDIQKLGGMEALEAPYLKISFFEMIKKRAGWLMALFLGEMFTASAMGHYANEIEKAVVLALFIPLIISSGGNSGSQASTLIIRAMALGEVRLRDWWRVLIKELFSGLVLGTLLGSIGLIRVMLWPSRDVLYGPQYMAISLVVALSLLGVVLWGTLAGSMLPFLLRKLGFDPASASAPFVATLVDVTGLVIYFTLAGSILGGTII